MCVGYPLLDVLFAADWWHSLHAVEPAGCGPYVVAASCVLWLPVVGVATWQIAQLGSPIAVPQVEVGTAVVPLPLLWQVVVVQAPNGAP